MDEQISQFSSVTGADLDRAKFFIESSNGDVEAAIAAYYESGGAESTAGNEAQEVPSPAPTTSASAPAPTPASQPAASSSSGPRTLSGAPAESPSTSGWGSQAATNTGSRKPGAGFSASGGSRGGGIATLRDYRSDQPPARSKKDGDERDPENLYAGGERSGLSVVNPNIGRDRDQSDVVRDILEQARRAGEQGRGDGSDDDDEEGSSAGPSAGRGAAFASLFSGAGRTIGDSGPDPSAEGTAQTTAPVDAPAAAAGPERVERTLTFWANGFSIGDGPLFPYDDEQSKVILDQIKSGSAPLSLFNVRMGQRVSIGVAHRTDEQYTPPPMQPFGGSGNRLGSPAPGPAAASSSTASNAPTTTSSSSASTATAPTLDESQPITSLQIRTGDGSRLVGRFNHSHTVADVRSYIDSAAAGGNAQRAYTLHTSFPPKAIEDESQTLKDAGLVNAVVIQKWQQ